MEFELNYFQVSPHFKFGCRKTIVDNNNRSYPVVTKLPAMRPSLERLCELISQHVGSTSPNCDVEQIYRFERRFFDARTLLISSR